MLLLAALGASSWSGIGKLRRAEAYERALLAAALAAAAAFVDRGGDRLGLGDDRDPGRLPAAGGRGAAHLGGRPPAGRPAEPARPSDLGSRSPALALVSLVVIAMPMLAVRDVRQSQADARAGSSTAPWTPRGAPSASRASPPPRACSAPWCSRPRATWRQPRPPRGRQPARNRPTGAPGSPCLGSRPSAATPAAAVDAYRTARSLNPRSALFASGRGADHDEVLQMPDPETDDDP